MNRIGSFFLFGSNDEETCFTSGMAIAKVIFTDHWEDSENLRWFLDFQRMHDVILYEPYFSIPRRVIKSVKLYKMAFLCYPSRNRLSRELMSVGFN